MQSFICVLQNCQQMFTDLHYLKTNLQQYMVINILIKILFHLFSSLLRKYEEIL